MIKQTKSWTIEELRERYASINFPEYQREPNVWARAAKQRLIDSIARRFDIASIYIYQNPDRSLDCIDGRQRITSIMSFLGYNSDDEDNGFPVHITNEIYDEPAPAFAELEGMTFREIEEEAKRGNAEAEAFVSAVLKYPITIVALEGSRAPEEFNLQFTRLNLGTIINSGEKLHAMVGEMRDLCFSTNGLGAHPFLEDTNIPTRRYAREQVAATILAQLVAREGEEGSWTRTRHFDLQRFFKEHTRLTEDDKRIEERLRTLLDHLRSAFANSDVLRNRAMTVSTVLLAWERRVDSEEDARRLAEFLEEFMCRLHWQIGKGLDVDSEYRYLIDFQRHVTQASVEKPAVAARAKVLETEFDRWLETKEIRGDAEYRARTNGEPGRECRDVRH